MPIEYFGTSPKMRTGFINLDINTARLFGTTAGESWANATAAVGTLGGGLLSSATVPSLTANTTALRVMTLNWSSAGTGLVQFSPVVLPPDFSSLSAPTLNVLSGRVSAASSDTSPAWTINMLSGISATNALSIPITNITSSVATQYSGAITTTLTGGIGYPGVLTVLINPASSQDLNKLYACWIEYTKTLRG